MLWIIWSAAVLVVAQYVSRSTMLPIPDRPSPGLTTYDAKDPDTAFPPIEPLLPPEGAPNVLIILLDDVGFGAASTFGGPCRVRPRSEDVGESMYFCQVQE